MTPWHSDLLLALAPLAPLLGCLAAAPGRVSALARALAPWTAVPALYTALATPVGSTLDLPAVLVGVRLGIDATGQVFLVFTSLLWWLCGIYARAEMERDPRAASFWLFFSLALAGNLWLILARDLVAFYCGFVLMSLSSYGLVVHTRTDFALRAGRVYVGFAVAGELALLAGVVGLVAAAGAPELDALARSSMPRWALALAVLGFGIKAGALGVHVWLPLAHPAAPVPASALLSGAMIKAGLLGWLRVLPFDSPDMDGWGWMLFGAGVAAAFYGAVVGIRQSDPKTVLAYSSVSQMGLMTAGLGFALAAPAWSDAALTAVLLYAIHHALAKAALFLGVGLARRIGADRRALTSVALAIPALSLAGAPLTSGALAKSALKTPIGEAGIADPGPVLLLTLAAVGTTLLMIRFWQVLPWSESTRAHVDSRLWLPWLVLLVLGPVLALVPWSAVGSTSLDLLTAPKLAVALAPIAAGIVLAITGRRLAPGWPSARSGPRSGARTRARVPIPELVRRGLALRIPRPAATSAARLAGYLERAESVLRESSVSGALWLMLAAGLILLII